MILKYTKENIRMNKRKRIILLHHVKAQGGGTKSLIDIAYMLKKDFDVLLCLPKGSYETVKFASKYNISCHEMQCQIPTLNVFSGGPKVLSKNFISGIIPFIGINKCVKELLDLEPDVVVFNSIVTSIIASRIPGDIKKICFIRETFIHSPFNTLYRYVFENYIDGVAYIANHEKIFFKIKKPKQIIIPDTLEPSTIKYYEDDDLNKNEYNKSCFKILYMGGSAFLKGFDVVLNAMTYLNSNFKLMIVGYVKKEMFTIRNIIKHFYNIEYTHYLLKTRKLIKQLEGNANIQFLGYQDDISKLMCTCDVVVFPSNKPHQPRPCIEAGMYKKTVILSDFEATKEFFINNYNALTFIPGSGKDLANKIIFLQSHSDIKKQLELNNYKMSMEEHNFELIQEKTLSFITSIVL